MGAVNLTKNLQLEDALFPYVNQKKQRTSSLDIDHALYLYFLGLSTRSVSKAIFHINKVKRSHVFFAKKWKWIQKYKPQKISIKKKRISEFIVDETLIKVGPEYIWLWVTIYRARKQANSRTLLAKNSQGKKYVCC